MKLVFIDTESRGKSLYEFAFFDGQQRKYRGGDAKPFIEALAEADYIVGHNIIAFDWPLLERTYPEEAKANKHKCIDSLYLSVLCFPEEPSHALGKQEKAQPESANDAFLDAQKTAERYYYALERLAKHSLLLQRIFASLFAKSAGFGPLFSALALEAFADLSELEAAIQEEFSGFFCEKLFLAEYINKEPESLGFALALLAKQEGRSKSLAVPRWLHYNVPHIYELLDQLRQSRCQSCGYCRRFSDPLLGLEHFFGYSSYRSYGGKPLQEQAVRLALEGKSLLAIFPTGGGKSISFQVPALLAAIQKGALTVVISPLQSLMKDQVDNLEEQGISEAVTINGLLDPIERAQALARVENGQASLLYLSPEALRSRTIERLLAQRRVLRFVIDEAHCLSAWGQDFRIDYLYIAEFIKKLRELSPQNSDIAISCFTATAKPSVVEDICSYFREQLGTELQVVQASVSRENLRYKVYSSDKEGKYQRLRELIEERQCPTIVYVSRTKDAEQLAERLCSDALFAAAYHGQMDIQEKVENQNRFMAGELDIIVATSAFGMGVDKKDVGLVVHYNISDSLENYMQEAGRAGRDQKIEADCFILFHEEDLSKHFIMLNQGKMHIREIQQIWQAIKRLSSNFRMSFSLSAFEIARSAGWTDELRGIETRVRTAIAALEDAGYVKRGNNSPRIYADSLLSRNMQEVEQALRRHGELSEAELQNAKRISRYLIGQQRRQLALADAGEPGSSQVDQIADSLGLELREVLQIVALLRKAGVLSDQKDLYAFLEKGAKTAEKLLKDYVLLEGFFLQRLQEQETKACHVSLKHINVQAQEAELAGLSIKRLRSILNLWTIKKELARDIVNVRQLEYTLRVSDSWQAFAQRRGAVHSLAQRLLKQIYAISERDGFSNKEKKLLGFSLGQMQKELNAEQGLFAQEQAVTEGQIEDALFYLTRIGALSLEGGFLVLYNRMHIERKETDNRIQYKKDDYSKLAKHYQIRSQQIHIVGHYAQLMSQDEQKAKAFVQDYFTLENNAFLDKHFPDKADRLRISRNMSQAKYEQLYGGMSEEQNAILQDATHPYILVAAGPGSGKTRVLVHKLASLLLAEDVKSEQLLMLSFSRAAASEFSLRLRELVGPMARAVEIRTFHSFAFEILGQPGSLESSSVIDRAIELLSDEQEREQSTIAKSVLVVDEAQDMSEQEYKLLRKLRRINEDMRIILVGDDDQNIYAFRGANAKHMQSLLKMPNSVCYELSSNYRSARNIVAFCNAIAGQLSHRLKKKAIAARPDAPAGQVSLWSYQSQSFQQGLVEQLCAEERSGSLALLSYSNEDALQLARLLLHKGKTVRLLQQEDAYRLADLFELRQFLRMLETKAAGKHYISEELWQELLPVFAQRFERNKNSIYPLCRDLLARFEALHPSGFYLSDFLHFLAESKPEDFVQAEEGVVFVATMHKAKGKEFDHVYLYLPQFALPRDEQRRLFYVASSRAKSSLSVHYSGSGLQQFASLPFVQSQADSKLYAAAEEFVLQASLRKVYIDFFKQAWLQDFLSRCSTGQRLQPSWESCSLDGAVVCQYSKKFIEELRAWKNRGYTLQKARIYALVYWSDKEEGQEYLLLLPELLLQKEAAAN